MSLSIQQIRNGVYCPEIRQQYEAKLTWAENALGTVLDELSDVSDKCGVETTEFYQTLDNYRRIEETLKQAQRDCSDYRACTCGSGYIWSHCSGHPETGTMYCG